MAITAAGIREQIERSLDRLSDWSTRHRFWFESAGVTLFALVALAVIGSTALSRADAWEAQARGLSEVEARMRSAIAAFESPDTAEVAEWMASEQALLSLVAVDGDPLTIASLIARRAEEVGVGSIRVTLIPDADEAAGPVSMGEYVAVPEGTAIRAEIVEEIGAAIRLIGVLPPNVEVSSVSSVPEGSLVRSEFRFVVRVVEGPS